MCAARNDTWFEDDESEIEDGVRPGNAVVEERQSR